MQRTACAPASDVVCADGDQPASIRSRYQSTIMNVTVMPSSFIVVTIWLRSDGLGRIAAERSWPEPTWSSLFAFRRSQ